MLDWLSAAVCAGLLAFAAWVWPDLPASVPVHYGLSGEPDGWGVLLILPALAVGMYWFMTAVARHRDLRNLVFATPQEPGQRDRKVFLAVRLLGWLKLGVVLLITYLFVVSAAIARGGATGLGAWFLPVVVAGTLAIVACHVMAVRRG